MFYFPSCTRLTSDWHHLELVCFPSARDHYLSLSLPRSRDRSLDVCSCPSNRLTSYIYQTSPRAQVIAVLHLISGDLCSVFPPHARAHACGSDDTDTRRQLALRKPAAVRAGEGSLEREAQCRVESQIHRTCSRR